MLRINNIIELIKNKYRGSYYYLKVLFSKTTNEYDYLKGKKKCLVCLAADYGNLGDVAITYAQEKFLKERFPDYVIVDFPISKIISDLKSLSKVTTMDDIVTLTGGGYMGDRYFRSELLRQLIVRVFRNNKIISFPQTSDFSASFQSVELLRQAKKIYTSSPKLELWARENVSYEFMCNNFNNITIRLTPDIVMYLDEFHDNDNRSVITYCLRNDSEKCTTSSQIIEFIKNNFFCEYNTEYYDTHIGDVKLSQEQRLIELNKIWNQFKKSKLVITDRLHGMIFAYITGTPAIVVPNNNFKIEACYEWIKDCGYIFYVKDLSSFNIINFAGIGSNKEGYLKTRNKILSVFNSIVL